MRFFSNTTIENQAPGLKMGINLYPFGATMPGRSFTSSSYRYGFNGKENDNEVKGTGNQQDYGMRIYDPRLGKFLSVDPLSKEYPWNSTYAFAENQPIWAIDLDGLEKITIHQRTFAPWAVFGDIMPGQKPYKGDNRGFSVFYKGVTSRIVYIAKIDVATAEQIGKTNVYCHPSIGPKNFYGEDGSATETPDEVTKVDRQFNYTNFSGNFSGHDAQIEDYMAPDIDWTGNYSFNNSTPGILGVNFHLAGKGFPAYETFIEDEKGSKISIYNYTAPAKKGILRLFSSPDATIPGSYTNMRVGLDKDGNFNGNVTVSEWQKGKHWYSAGSYVDKTYTIEAWNEKQSKQKPSEDSK
jgi:RHS repeat-associated protein